MMTASRALASHKQGACVLAFSERLRTSESSFIAVSSVGKVTSGSSVPIDVNKLNAVDSQVVLGGVGLMQNQARRAAA